MKHANSIDFVCLISNERLIQKFWQFVIIEYAFLVIATFLSRI